MGLPDRGTGIVKVPLETAFPNGRTGHINPGSFEKVGRIVMCDEGMEIHSDLEERGFILLDVDIDAVLEGDKRDIGLANLD